MRRFVRAGVHAAADDRLDVFIFLCGPGAGIGQRDRDLCGDKSSGAHDRSV